MLTGHSFRMEGCSETLPVQLLGEITFCHSVTTGRSVLFRRNILLFIMDQPAVDQGDYIFFFQVLDKVLNSILA